MPVHSLQDAGHRCARFRAAGLEECPFRRFLEDEDDDDDLAEEKGKEGIPFMMPARRKRDMDAQNNLRQFVIPHSDAPMRKALERLAAFKNIGGMPSVPDFPFGGRGHPEIIAGLAAIAIMRALSAMRSSGSRPSMGAVSRAETLSGKGLKSLQRGAASFGQGRPVGPGRGGFSVNVSAELRRLFGGVVRKRLLDASSVIPPGGGPK